MSAFLFHLFCPPFPSVHCSAGAHLPLFFCHTWKTGYSMLGISISRWAPCNTTKKWKRRNASRGIHKWGQSTQVNLLHRWHLAAIFHLLNSTLAHRSVNALAFKNFRDKAFGAFYPWGKTPRSSEPAVTHTIQQPPLQAVKRCVVCFRLDDTDWLKLAAASWAKLTELHGLWSWLAVGR